jgi:hypothetical protein
VDTVPIVAAVINAAAHVHDHDVLVVVLRVAPNL